MTLTNLLNTVQKIEDIILQNLYLSLTNSDCSLMVFSLPSSSQEKRQEKSFESGEIMSIHDGHRQRKKEQFRQHGLESFADHEALELLLFYAIPRKDTNPIAHKLLDHFGSLSQVFEATEEELKKIEGDVYLDHGNVLIRYKDDISSEVKLANREKISLMYQDIYVTDGLHYQKVESRHYQKE